MSFSFCVLATTPHPGDGVIWAKIDPLLSRPRVVLGTHTEAKGEGEGAVGNAARHTHGRTLTTDRRIRGLRVPRREVDEAELRRVGPGAGRLAPPAPGRWGGRGGQSVELADAAGTATTRYLNVLPGSRRVEVDPGDADRRLPVTGVARPVSSAPTAHVVLPAVQVMVTSGGGGGVIVGLGMSCATTAEVVTFPSCLCRIRFETGCRHLGSTSSPLVYEIRLPAPVCSPRTWKPEAPDGWHGVVVAATGELAVVINDALCTSFWKLTETTWVSPESVRRFVTLDCKENTEIKSHRERADYQRHDADHDDELNEARSRRSKCPSAGSDHPGGAGGSGGPLTRWRDETTAGRSPTMQPRQ